MSDEKEKDISLKDIFQKVVSTGVSAAFMTEEAIKSTLKDLPIPKEAVNNLIKNAKSTKEDFIHSVKNELKTYLDNIDVSKEVDRILEKYDFEISAKVSAHKKKASANKKA